MELLYKFYYATGSILALKNLDEIEINAENKIRNKDIREKECWIWTEMSESGTCD